MNWGYFWQSNWWNKSWIWDQVRAWCCQAMVLITNTLRQAQNGQHLSNDIFKCIFLNENAWIFKILLKFVLEGPINNIPASVQIMSWHQPGDKPLSEPIMVRLLTHICITWPQWLYPWFWIHINANQQPYVHCINKHIKTRLNKQSNYIELLMKKIPSSLVVWIIQFLQAQYITIS